MCWVREHVHDFNVDPNRICAIGHSSGAHLAGLAATTESFVEGISSRVNCVVDLSGDADLTVGYADPMWSNALAGMFGGTLEEVPEDLAGGVAGLQRGPGHARSSSSTVRGPKRSMSRCRGTWSMRWPKPSASSSMPKSRPGT